MALYGVCLLCNARPGIADGNSVCEYCLPLSTQCYRMPKRRLVLCPDGTQVFNAERVLCRTTRTMQQFLKAELHHKACNGTIERKTKLL